MEPIAITAMAGVFPGASDIEAYWQNILKAQVAPLISLEKRWGIPRDTYFHPEPGTPGRVYFDKAFCIQDEQPDSPAYGAGRQVKIGKQVVKNVLDELERSGSIPDKRHIALVAGTSWTDQSYLDYDVACLSGKAFNKGRMEDCIRDVYPPEKQLEAISSTVGLGGPCLSVDNACASSVYALDLGISLLRNNQAHAVVVLGLNAYLAPFLYTGFSKLTALSKQGEILPFSSQASGLIPGEAAGAVIIEPLERAISQGRHIYAVIRSLGLSADGAERSVFAPGQEGQILAIKRAYEGINPGDIDYIEAHGTATVVGDETELKVLDKVFSTYMPKGKKLPVGSVKSLVGHTLAAAGITSIIKALLMLREKTIPPHIQIEPLPMMSQACLDIPREAKIWDECARPRRIGISSFGFGGANAHLVLEEYTNKSQKIIKSGRSSKTEAVPAAYNFEPIAIIDFESAFGEAHGVDSCSRMFKEKAYEFKPFPWRRFNFDNKNDQPYDIQVSGSFFPDSITIDAQGLRIGPNFLKRIDPFQVLATHLSNVLLDRHPEVKESTETAVVFCNNMGGEMTLKTYRKYANMFGQETGRDNGLETQKRDAAYDITLEEIASGLPNMLSGYPASQFNLRACHETVSGGAGIFWTNLVASSYWFKNRCKSLVLGAGNLFKSPVDIIQLFAGKRNEIICGEGLGVFLIKSFEQAQKDKDKVLAVVSAVIPGELASNFNDACRLAGINPSDVDIHEYNQTNPDWLGNIRTSNNSVSCMQELSGFMGEASGIEALSGVLISEGRLAAIEIHSGDKLVMTVFLEKKERIIPTRRPVRMPVNIDFQPQKAKEEYAIEEQKESQEPVIIRELENLFAWQQSTANAVHSYLDIQRKTLAAFFEKQMDRAASAQDYLGRGRIVEDISIELEKSLLKLRRDPFNIALSHIKYVDGEYTGEILVREEHPYFFDHPIDHVPGALILEGILQLAEAAVQYCLQKSKGQEYYIKMVDISFNHFCEKNIPAVVKLTFTGINGTDGALFNASVIQGGTCVSTAKLEVSCAETSLYEKISYESKQAVCPDKKTVHKRNHENVFVSKLESIDEGSYTCEVFDPPDGHIFSEGNLHFRSILYLFETTRQFFAQLAHGTYGIPVGLPMNLLSIKISLDRPAYRCVPMKISCKKQPLTQVGGMILGRISNTFSDGYGQLGEGSLYVQVIDEETYLNQRAVKRGKVAQQ